MTKKDYITLAEAIISMDTFTKPEDQVKAMRDTVEVMTYKLIEQLEKDNPKFNKKTFIKYINDRTKNIYIC